MDVSYDFVDSIYTFPWLFACYVIIKLHSTSYLKALTTIFKIFPTFEKSRVILRWFFVWLFNI